MRVIASPIPDGSQGVRVWVHEPAGDDEPSSKPDYDFCCVLIRLSDTECEVAQAMSRLTSRITGDAFAQVGLKAYALGYRVMRFRVKKGRKATRWATYSHTADGMDHYTVDLARAMEIYKGRD